MKRLSANANASARNNPGNVSPATIVRSMHAATPRSILHSVIDAVRELGAWNGYLYLLSRALTRATHGHWRLVKYYLVAQPVPTLSYLKRRGGDIIIERIERNHPLTRQFPRPAEVLSKRFADGGVCFAASKRGTFVGFIWLQHNRYEEDEVRCIFRPMPIDKAVWDYDVYVEPEFRMGRTFLRLWDVAHDYLRERNIDWTVSRISAFNVESLASHRRLGATRIATAIFLCAGRVQGALFSTRPWLHFSLSTRLWPELPLETRIIGKGVPREPR